MTFWKKRFTTVLVGQLDFVPSQLYLLFQKMSRRSIKSVLELTWEKCYNVASKSSWEVTWGRCCNIASRAFSKLLTPTHPLRSITSIRRCQVRYYPPHHPTPPHCTAPHPTPPFQKQSKILTGFPLYKHYIYVFICKIVVKIHTDIYAPFFFVYIHMWYIYIYIRIYIYVRKYTCIHNICIYRVFIFV